MFPSWFAGIGYSAIVIGALVPAAIMSIAAANLFTRNIYREFFRPDASPAEQTRVAQLVSLIVKLGALVFVLALSKTFSINLQLLGGIWILQTFPAIVAGLYTRWFHRWALIIGWAAAMVYGTIEAYRHARERPAPLRRLDGADPRAHHLHRDRRVRAQPGDHDCADADLPRGQAAGRGRRDPARAVQRRSRGGSSRSGAPLRQAPELE